MLSAFGDTRDLERSLLHQLSKSKMLTRMHMHRVREDWFTSKERKFIASTAYRIYMDTKSPLTRRIFDHEIKMRIDPKEETYYVSEWNLIEGMSVNETIEVLIDRLVEAHVGRQLLNVIEDSAAKLDSGDISEALAGLKSSMMQISLRGDEKPTREITDYKHRLDLIRDKQQHPEKYLGVKTGIFPTFDRRMGGLFAGELTLIAGLTGLGKSTFVKALQWGIITHNPTINVLHIANEEYDIQVENKFDALLTEIPYLDFKFARITDDDLNDWVAKMEDMKANTGTKYGRIFTKEVPAFTDVTLIEQAYRELENQGIDIGLIVIDHLPHVVPIRKAYDKNDEQAKAASDCKEIARSLSLPVIIPTQAATDVEEKTKRGKKAGALDVYGSKGQIHVANNFGIIMYKRKAEDQPHLEDEDKDVIWTVDFKKTRDGAKFHFPARHYVQYGKVLEITQNSAQDDEEVKEALDEAIPVDEEEADEEAQISKAAAEAEEANKKFDQKKEEPKEVEDDNVAKALDEAIGESSPEPPAKSQAAKKGESMLEKIRKRKANLEE